MNITVELLQQSPSTYFISHYMCVYKYKKEYCFSKMLVLLCNYFLDQVRHLLLNAELTCMTLSEYAASIIKSSPESFQRNVKFVKLCVVIRLYQS